MAPALDSARCDTASIPPSASLVVDLHSVAQVEANTNLRSESASGHIPLSVAVVVADRVFADVSGPCWRGHHLSSEVSATALPVGGHEAVLLVSALRWNAVAWVAPSPLGLLAVVLRSAEAPLPPLVCDTRVEAWLPVFGRGRKSAIGVSRTRAESTCELAVVVAVPVSVHAHILDSVLGHLGAISV